MKQRKSLLIDSCVPLCSKFDNIATVRDSAVEKMVLDYDIETKKELVAVDPKLVKKLKPHQKKGVKFMWDNCFESLKQISEGKQGGCILAHCMGLGKTLQVVFVFSLSVSESKNSQRNIFSQVISFVHTLLSNEETKVKTVLILCPLNTVSNWRAEFELWLEDLHNKDDINIYDVTMYVESQWYVKDSNIHVY